jgi:5-methylthioadenosine/S-adenosylhomocysteine deaminase
MRKIERLIHAQWIVPIDADDSVLNDHCLAIDNGVIIDILPSHEADVQYQAKIINDCTRHVLIPGLINTHTHAAMSLLKGLSDDLPLMDWLENHIWPVEDKWVSAEFVYQGTQLAIAEIIRSGTTCFNDMYFFPEAIARAADEAKIRASIGMIVIDFPSAYAKNANDYLQKGLEVHDEFASNTLINFAFAPHAPYTVSDNPLKKLHQLSREKNIPVHIHLHETAHEVQEAINRTGKRPLDRLDELELLNKHLIAVHMTQLTDAEITLLRDKKVNIIHCPESNLKLASGFCPVNKLIGAGINVALGTDSNASNNDLDMLGEIRTASLLAKGVSGDARSIPAYQAIRMATLNGAVALGMDNITGSLEIGKAADVVAIKLDAIETSPLYNPVSHLVYCANRSQVTEVWVAGRQLLDNRKLTTLDEHQLLINARKWQQRLTPY